MSLVGSSPTPSAAGTRDSFSGRTPGFQPGDAGSIPVPVLTTVPLAERSRHRLPMPDRRARPPLGTHAAMARGGSSGLDPNREGSSHPSRTRGPSWVSEGATGHDDSGAVAAGS